MIRHKGKPALSDAAILWCSKRNRATCITQLIILLRRALSDQAGLEGSLGPKTGSTLKAIQLGEFQRDDMLLKKGNQYVTTCQNYMLNC